MEVVVADDSMKFSSVSAAHPSHKLFVRACGAPTFSQEKRLLLERCDFLVEVSRETQMGVEAREELLFEIANAASPEALDDPELALAVAGVCGSCLKHFSERFRHDIGVVLAAVQDSGMALESAPEALRGVRDIALAAVTSLGVALRWTSPELQRDQEVVFRAVKQDGLALEYASIKLRAEREVVLPAVKQNGLAVKYASRELRADREVMLEALKQNFEAWQFAEKDLCGDKDVMLEVVRHRGACLESATCRLQADFEVVQKAVRQDGIALKHAASCLQDNKEIVELAVGQTGKAVRYASTALLRDKDIMMRAARSPHGGAGQGKKAQQAWENDVSGGSEDVILPSRGHQENSKVSDRDRFWEAYDTALAFPGQPALVLTAVLTVLPNGSFQCELHVLSGTNFTCEVSCVGQSSGLSGQKKDTPSPELKDLANEIQTELPKHVEITGSPYFFIDFQANNEVDENILATVWDWERPLTEFLFQ